MTRVLSLGLLLAALAACGVDGPPIPPSQVPEEEPEPRAGILITGSAEAGVSGTF